MEINSVEQLLESKLDNFTVTEDIDVSLTLFLEDTELQYPIQVNQNVPRNSFNLKVKIVLFGTSKLEMPIDLHVNQGATETETQLNGVVYIMSQQSNAKVVPSLYIHEKNILGASHGMVIKNIKDKDLIYFNSRGIENTTAKELILGTA